MLSIQDRRRPASGVGPCVPLDRRGTICRVVGCQRLGQVHVGQAAQRSPRAQLGQGHRLRRRHRLRRGRGHLPHSLHRGHGLPKPRQPNGRLHHRGRHRLRTRELGHPSRGDRRARPMGPRGRGYVGVPHSYSRATLGRPKTAYRHRGHPRHEAQSPRLGREHGHAGS